jgi:hypothetical protein
LKVFMAMGSAKTNNASAALWVDETASIQSARRRQEEGANCRGI